MNSHFSTITLIHRRSDYIWVFLCPKEYLYCDFYIIFLFCIFRGSFYFPDCLAKLNIDKVYYYNFNKLSKIFEEMFEVVKTSNVLGNCLQIK